MDFGAVGFEVLIVGFQGSLVGLRVGLCVGRCVPIPKPDSNIVKLYMQVFASVCL